MAPRHAASTETQTAFSHQPREQFDPVIPRISVLLAEQIDPAQVEEGRQVEARQLLEREHFVETARALEMITGEEEFTFSSPLRHALVESQCDPNSRIHSG